MEMDGYSSTHLSYLRARDPSILSGNMGLGLKGVRVNLANGLLEDTAALPQVKDHLQIYLRIKKTENSNDIYEVNGNVIECNVPVGSNCLRNVKDGYLVKRKYKFSRIFENECTQADLFNAIVKPKMLHFINAKSSTLMTYGASGSGKTYTIVGTALEPGLIPRALEYLFRTLPPLSQEPTIKPNPAGDITFLSDVTAKHEKDVRANLLSNSLVDRQHVRTYKAMQQRLSTEPVATLDDLTGVVIGVWVSFAEIYNEYVYDLLKHEPPRGQQRDKLHLGKLNENCYVKNLTSVSVSSGLEAYQILQYGLHNLKYAATSINSHSSRSHCIFTIKLAQASSTERGFYVSNFNFCDLAGSERVKKTLNIGDRLKESNNINKSLLVLGKCMSSIRESQKNNDNNLIPFRESKLTQLFQRALSGLEDIAMIVNMNPIRNMFDETQHVLNFSAIAKDIIVEQPKIIKPKRIGRFSQYMNSGSTEYPIICEQDQDEEIENLKDIIASLTTELEHHRFDRAEYDRTTRAELHAEYEKLTDQMNKLRKEREAALEKFHEDEMKMQIELLKEEYEMRCVDKTNDHVIDLTEEDDDNSPLLNELNAQISMLKNENYLLKKRLLEIPSEEQVSIKYKLESELKESEYNKLKQEMAESKSILADAVHDYLELEKKYNLLLTERNKLQSEKFVLNEKLDELTTLEIYQNDSDKSSVDESSTDSDTEC